MPVRVEKESDPRVTDGAQTAKGRLYEWSRERHWAVPNSFPPSPFAKIAEMQENAGARSVGIKYDMIQEEVDEEAVACRPDGGMSALVEKYRGSLPHHIRTRDTAASIATLPESLRMVVLTMYGVAVRERPRSDRVVSDLLSITRLEVIRRLERAYGWIGRDLGLPPI